MTLGYQIGGTFRLHRPLYILVCASFIAAAILHAYYDFIIMWRAPAVFLFFGGSMMVVLFVCVVLVKTIHIVGWGDRDRPLTGLLNWLHHTLIRTPRLANGIHASVLLSGTLIVFGTLKNAMPYLVPFYLDHTFYWLDGLFMRGETAWSLLRLSALPDYVFVAINIVYNSWFFFLVGFVTFLGFAKNTLARITFLASALLTWIVAGTLLATLMSSAGPCYYGFVVDGFNPYEEQMAHLRAVQERTGMVWSVIAQDRLWTSYSNCLDGAFSGISAMPSLHVVFAVLMALAAREFSRLFGRFMTVFAILIFIGSVMLAWHYLVDSLFGVVWAVAVWFGCRRYISKSLRRSNCPDLAGASLLA